jgi:hypothetical protein
MVVGDRAQEASGASPIDYKVRLAMIYVGWFVGTVAMVLIMLFVFYDPLRWFPSLSTRTIPSALAPDSIGPFLAKLFAYFSVPLGVVLGGIFGTDARGAALATRSNVLLLYTLSNAWGAIILAAVFISVITPANIFEAVGTGAAILTTIPLAAVFTRASTTPSATNPNP